MTEAAPKWDRHSILAEFRRRGMKLNDFAKLHGRKPGSLSKIWTSYNRTDEKLIADFLGCPVEEVFPDRYPITRNRLFRSSESRVQESQKSPQLADRSAA